MRPIHYVSPGFPRVYRSPIATTLCLFPTEQHLYALGAVPLVQDGGNFIDLIIEHKLERALAGFEIGVGFDMNGKGHSLNLNLDFFARLDALAIIATLLW